MKSIIIIIISKNVKEMDFFIIIVVVIDLYINKTKNNCGLHCPLSAMVIVPKMWRSIP
jgi:hypothetical protein